MTSTSLRYRRLLLPVVFTVLLAWVPGNNAVAQTDGPTGSWVNLGPQGPNEAYGIGVSSDWPDDRFLIARFKASDDQGTNRRPAAQQVGMRSYDGGQTWDPLDDAPPSDRVHVLRTARHGRVILALPERKNPTPPVGEVQQARRVLRSMDDGQSWVPALDINGDAPPRLVISPTLVEDGRAFILDDGALYETTDIGLTWERRTPMEGQQIADVAFSPTYATDRTLLISATVDGFPRPGRAFAADAHSSSAGILMSRDGGVQWTSISTGLQVDGVPYRHVQSIAISSAFERDRTIFAFAWGPWDRFEGEYAGHARFLYSALFRSRDGGASWQVVWQPPYTPNKYPGGYISQHWLTIVPSPAYAADGVVVAAVTSAAGNPGSAGCRLLFSADHGERWEGGAWTTSDSACWGLTVLPGPPVRAIWGATNGPSGNVFITNDGGQTRSAFGPPSRWTGGPIPKLPTVAPDGTIFFGAIGGIWVLAPGVQPPAPD